MLYVIRPSCLRLFEGISTDISVRVVIVELYNLSNTLGVARTHLSAVTVATARISLTDHIPVVQWEYDLTFLRKEAPVKKLIAGSLITVLMLLTGALFIPTHAQSPETDLKPTFISPTPGLYVNGWPRFTVIYPKDWVERRPMQVEAFRASAPGSGTYPAFMAVSVLPYPLPLDKLAEDLAATFRSLGFTDVTLVSDRSTQLGDGTPAREIEFRFVMMGTPRSVVALDTKKGGLVIQVHVSWPSAETGERERLKEVLFSIRFQPDKGEPAKVPPDVQALIDRHCSAYVAHDLAQVMANYSDRYLSSGVRKREMELMHRQGFGRATSCEIGISDFIPAGDKAYLAGFVSGWWGKAPLQEMSIIKENGN